MKTFLGIRPLRVVLALVALGSSGCKSEEPRRDPPPPAARPAVGACNAPAKVHDPTNVAALPPKVAAFCLDPTGSDRGYGEGAKAPLEPGICELYDGECAIYTKLGAKRVVEARYVDGAGSTATLDVKLSQFGSPEQALAMFTKRALGAGDPAHPDTPKPLEAGGLATLGVGNAYLWKGTNLAEIMLNDADLSAQQLEKRAAELLPILAKEVGSRLQGSAELPAAVRRLPTESRLPLGLKLELPDLLVEGAGPGAFGFYKDGDKRWRVAVLSTNDEAQAKRAFGALAVGGATEKALGDAATRVLVGDTKAEWLFARKGGTVVGVGDETYVLKQGMTADERRVTCLDPEAKRAKLTALLVGP